MCLPKYLHYFDWALGRSNGFPLIMGLGLAGCREELWGGQGGTAGPALLSHT